MSWCVAGLSQTASAQWQQSSLRQSLIGGSWTVRLSLAGGRNYGAGVHCATRKPAEGTEIVAMWPLLRSQGGRKVAAPNAKWPPPWGPGTKYEYKEVNIL